MKKIAWKNLVKFKTKQQAAFVISASLIGLIFVLSIIGLLTRKFQPLANEVGSNNGRRPLMRIDPSNLTFKNLDGSTKVVPSNAVSTILAPYPEARIILDGKNELPTSGFKLDGQVSFFNGNQRIGSTKNWETTKVVDNSKAQVKFTDQATVESLDTLPDTAPLSVVIKPKDYLAKKIQVSDIDQPLQATFAPGDYNNDNSLTVEDFVIWSAEFDKPITDQNRRFDVDGDGQIGPQDFIKAFGTDTFNTEGPDL